MEPAKRKKWKRRVSWLGGILAVAFVMLNIIAFRQASAMMHFENGKARTEIPEKLSGWQKVKVLFVGVNLPRPRAEVSLAELGTNARSFMIPSDDGIELGAWYSPAASNAPLVILFHGYGAEKSTAVMAAKAFMGMGYSALLVDFRGSGESSESYTTIGYLEADDVAAAVRFARAKLAPPKLVLYGVSMGAASVLRAVSRCGVKPDAIIVEAVFDTLLHTVQHRFEAMHIPSLLSAQLLVFWGGRQFGFNGFAHNPVDYARDVRCPILFLHGADDPRARLADGMLVYDAVPGEKRFKEFPGVAHAETLAREPVLWKNTVRDFLNHNLPMQLPTAPE